MNGWAAKVLTLFPDMFPGPLGHSLAGKALMDEVWSLNAIDIRRFARDKHQKVDDTPFGGGPGMVMRPDVVDRALGEVMSDLGDVRLPVLYMSPRGVPLTQARVRSLSAGPGVVIVCGRYEGLDERVIKARQMEEVSVGDYILSGGELAALALMDACIRLLPGVMGSDESPEEESFEQGLLEYPHYTRPRTWCNRNVPEVLLSGHHERVRAWRQAKAEEITRERRPDLWDRFAQDRDPSRH